jgi:hypothetical protein
MSFRNALKSLYYAIKPPQLTKANSLQLGYVFHTEMIFEKKYFETMLHFLPRYQELTGCRAIATLMSGKNPRVRDGIRNAGITEKEFVSRLLKIGEYATLGYHGHFVHSPEHYKEFSQQIRGAGYDMAPIKIQIQAELDWFCEKRIKIGPYYSGGWWFHAPELYEELVRQGFQFDFSQSFAPWYRSPVIYPILQAKQVLCGEPLALHLASSKMYLVQNLVGCHNTIFPEDFIRNMQRLLKNGFQNPVAVVNSHDFDLQEENTLAALEKVKHLGARFFDETTLASLVQGARSISF